MGQIIPEAAVEAAAKAIHEAGGFYEWEDPEGWREKSATHEARAALEAAAPHMLAEAWARGAQAGFESTAEGFNGECVFDHCAPDNYPPTNPYSGAKWKVG